MKNATKACENASKTRGKAKKALEDEKSEHSFATKEMEDARSYSEELYKKNEVIDVDDESPARKKQRSSL